MRTLNRIAFLLLLAGLFAGCEESGGPTDNSDPGTTPKKITLNDLYGTFKLEHMQFVYFGTAITDTVSDETPGLTFTGTMTLAKTGEIVQTVAITHADSTESILMTGKINEIPSDTLMVITTGGRKIEAEYVWKNPRLTLILYGMTENNTVFKDTETWRRTSRIISKSSDLQNTMRSKSLASPGRNTSMLQDILRD